MKAKTKLTWEREGFGGYFYEAPDSRKAMVVLLGDDGNDFMDTSCAKWLTRAQNCNALCVALRRSKKDESGIHCWELEQVEKAVRWLFEQGMEKVGLLGMSIQGAMALTAASLIPQVSLVIAMSPCDFVPWGFVHGKIGKDRDGEWPSGTSAFSWKGQELPFQPAGLGKEAYWQMYCDARKQYREMHSKTVFEYSEQAHPVAEEAFIKGEHIRGKVVLTGAEDDSMWDSVRYMERMKERLLKKGFAEGVQVFRYPYGTHLLVPERWLRMAIPVAGDLLSRLFISGRKHPAQCRQAREDLEQKLTSVMEKW